MKSFPLLPPLILLAALPLGAQSEHSSQVSVPDDPVVRQALGRAEEALDQEDLDRALRTWQEILDRMETKVVPTERGPRSGNEADRIVGGDRFAGVREEVMRLIRSLPEAARGRYLELMEPKARDLLAQGVALGDESWLREAYRRFALTPSGRRAGFALVDLYLEHGRHREARLTAQRLRTHLAEEASPGPEYAQALAREALALRGAGSVEELKRLRESLGAGEPELPLKVVGESTTLSAFLGVLLESGPGRRQPEQRARLELGSFRTRIWSRPFQKNNNTGENLVFQGRSVPAQVAYFPVVPAVRDGVIYSCDGRLITARSLFTGEDLWPPVAAPVPDYSGRRNRNLFFHVALEDNLLVGYLEGPPLMEAQRAWQGFEPIEAIPTRKLVAVDAATGHVIWSHHTFSPRSAEEADFISRLIVNQPPLIRGDTLYVAGTVFLGVFHQWICAFERDTGHLRWRTYTGAGQMELNMFGNPIKEATPGHVAEYQGVLYYSTNIGVLAAVDAVTGTIIWESAYDQEGIPATDSPVTQERHPGWMPAAPAVWRDRLFVAPTDAYDLYVAALDTGELTTVPAARRTYSSWNTYFLGIHQGLVLVAGTQVTAMAPDSLQEKWRTAPLSLDRRSRTSVQGMPAILGSDLIFATINTRDRQTTIHRVDLATGRFEESQAFGRIDHAGNIAVSDDALVVGGEDYLHAYFELGEVEKRLRREVQRRPDDPELLLRLADVLQRHPNWEQALSTYEKARSLARAKGAPTRQVARRASLALFNGWLEVARQPSLVISGAPVKPEDRFRRALSYAETEAQRVRALLLLMDFSLERDDRGAFGRAVDSLTEEHPKERVVLEGRLLQLLPDLAAGTELFAGLLGLLVAGVQAETSGNLREAVDKFQRIQVEFPEALLGKTTAWSYAGDRILAILSSAGTEAYRRHEQEARRLLAGARRGEDLEPLRIVLRHYPQSSVAEEAYLELIRRLLARGESRDALAEMQSHFARFRTTGPAPLLEYARCLENLGAHDSALQVLKTLRHRYGNERVKLESGIEKVEAWVDEQLKRAPFAAMLAPTEAPALSRHLRVAWALGDPQGGEDAHLLHFEGRDPAPDLVLVHLERELVALTTAEGQVAWKKPCSVTPRRGVFHDGKLVLSLDGDVVALDPRSGRELWRLRPEGSDLNDLAAGQGRVYLLLRTLLRSAPLVLQAVDLNSGNLVQEIPFQGLYAGRLDVSPGYVLVSGDRDRQAICCDALTGQVQGSSFSFRSDGPEPFLTEEDLVVLVLGARPRSDGTVSIVGRDPATLEDRWVYDAGRGNYVPLGVCGDTLVFEIYTPRSALRGPGGAVVANRRVIALDLRRGLARLTADLDRNEVCTPDSQKVGDRLYVNLHATLRTGFAKKIRAFDLDRGRSPWATADFSGANLNLAILPTADYLLVMKAASSRTGRPTEPTELYFIDNRTGAVEDLIDLGEARVAADTMGLEVKQGTLVVAAGSQVRAHRP